MKKAIIITAVLFVLSSLVTVFSAVALGANGLSQLADYVRDNGGIEAFYPDSDEDEGVIDGFVGDIEDRFNSRMLDGRDFSIIGNPDYQISGDKATSLDISDKQELTVKADVAKVIIKSTSDAFMSVSADVYSSKRDAVTGGYDLILFDEGFDVYLKSDRNLKDAVGVLTLEIPESYKGKITVNVGIGELVTDGAKLDALEAKVDVGEISAANASMDSAALYVSTGEIDIAKSFNCFTSLTADTQIGSIEYNLPEGRLTDIEYSVKTGSVETDGLEQAGFTVTGTTQAGFESVSSSGKISGSYGDTAVDTVLKVFLNTGIGDVEFNVG